MSAELIVPTLDDAAALCELIIRSEAFDHVPRQIELEELLLDLADPHLDLAHDVRLATIDGQLVGWVRIRHVPSGARLERADILGDVDPDHRRCGIGTALMDWATAAATNRLHAIANDLPKFVRAYSYVNIEDRQLLMARRGYVPVRWFDDLLMDLANRPNPTTPAGISIVSWPTSRDAEIKMVKNTAFADHWGSTPSDEAAWRAMAECFGARLDLSFVAINEATDDIVAMCFNEHYPADAEVVGYDAGVIGTLGTLREFRGRGLGSALISHSLAAFAAAGFSHASIAVDSENPTGASRLYRSLGFQPNHQEVAYQIQVA